MKKITAAIFIGIFIIRAGAAETQTVMHDAAVVSQAESAGEDDAFDDSGFTDEFDNKSVNDPLEGYNRWMTSFNETLFDYVLDPVFKGYDFIFPEPVRVSINNVFNNLYYPVSLVNNLLQLKFENALSETGRFIVNSTFGFAGMFDTARDGLGIEPHVEDFGQTLGYYGVGGGFPIVLPFFGPTNLRDFSGDLLDFYVNPIYYVDARKYNIPNNTYQGWGLVTYKEFNRFSLYEKEYKQLRGEALDFYPLMRDAYEQNRDKLISE
jgi:phospholipid-binding lipoprotein MlaA